MLSQFNNSKGPPVLVASRKLASVGWNCVAANHVIIVDKWWNPQDDKQCIARVHRIGQDEPVTAWRIIAAHTIDARIADLIGSKQGLAARALDGSQEEDTSADSIQASALVYLLTQALDGQL